MLIKNTIQLNDGTQFFIQLSIDTIKLQLIDDDNHDNFFEALQDLVMHLKLVDGYSD